MADTILLYRYMDSSAALRTIESRAFRVTRLHGLNDPFEWRPGVTNVIPRGEEIARAATEKSVAHMDSWMGVLCFSDTVAEPVLWSHYADKHRGVSFEVDYERREDHLFKMDYTETRPVIDANRLLNNEGLSDYFGQMLKKLMRQKSSGWSYEREYRVHIELEVCQISAGQYLMRIPDNFLKRVILGFQCPLEELYVKRALEKSGLGSTEVVRAKRCLETYAIRC